MSTAPTDSSFGPCNDSCRPNVFILGAPKCGTSSLKTYLGSHADVYTTEAHEPHFFSSDLNFKMGANPNREKFLSLFEDVKNQSIRIESSTWYLYSRDAVSNILKFSPDAKFIIMLRNPVSLAQSLHQHLVFTGREPETDFERAWLDCKNGLTRVPEADVNHHFVNYPKNCCLGSQLQRALSNIPHGRAHCILLDDLNNNPREVYKETLEFLDVADDNKNDFTVVNSARQPRVRWLHSLLVRPPNWLKKSVFSVKHTLGISRLGIKNRLLPKVTHYQKNKERNPAIRKEVLDTFLSEITLLESLLKRDLSTWKQ